MKTQIKLNKMEIQNFKGCKNRTIDFFDKTEIKGKNEAGKTTVNDAFTWVLFGKDSQGNKKFDARPQDTDRKQIDFIDIVVKLFLEVNGESVEIEKTQKQKWVKKRGQDEKVFEGNVNSYVVDTIPKAEKDFKKYIDEIISEDIFKYVSNINAFMLQNSKDRRKTLFELVASIKNDTIIATDKKFQGKLAAELKKHTYDELMARDKKDISDYKKKLDEIPSRIDEVSKSIVEVDYTETENKLAGLKKELAEISEPGADALAKYNEIADIKVEIVKAELDLKMLKTEKETQSTTEKKQAYDESVHASSLLDAAIDLLKGFENQRKNIIEDTEDTKKRHEQLKEQYLGLKKLKSDGLCPICHRELVGEEKSEMLEDFKRDQTQSLSDVNVKGQKIKKKLEFYKAELEKIDKEIPIRKAEIEQCEKDLELATAKVNALPNKDFDIMDCQEYVDGLNTLQKLKETFFALKDSVNDIDKMKEEAENKKADIQAQIDECNQVLAGQQAIEDAKARVDELKAEQQEIAQKSATTEKEIYLLEEFNKAKVNLLSEKINSHFELVTWKLFANQINGGYAEVCEPMVKGKSYATALNSGHKILAELDIIKALQKIYDCQVPVFLDNAERVNKFNLPNMECQLISLRVSEPIYLYAHDDDGNIIYDKNGNPCVIKTVYDGSLKIENAENEELEIVEVQ